MQWREINLKTKQKRNPKNKDTVEITISFSKELAESVRNFKDMFKPEHHTIDGKIIEFSENDFWKQVLLLGAESLKQQLLEFVDKEKKRMGLEIQGSPLPETIDQNIN